MLAKVFTSDSSTRPYKHKPEPVIPGNKVYNRHRGSSCKNKQAKGTDMPINAENAPLATISSSINRQKKDLRSTNAQQQHNCCFQTVSNLGEACGHGELPPERWSGTRLRAVMQLTGGASSRSLHPPPLTSQEGLSHTPRGT